jgi:DNA-binding NarL/FixJ family response regulator
MHDKTIKVLLVDDHAVVRSGVRLILDSAPNIEVTAEAENAQDALRFVHLHDFDIALVDIEMNGKSGLDLLKILRREKPLMKVLMLSMYSEDVYAVRAIKLGASGYLTKSSPAAEMVAAVQKVVSGKKYISPLLADKLVDMVRSDESDPFQTLSNRELEIMKLIASGESLVEIAHKLHLSASTVTTYRKRILEKTGLTSNAALAQYARESGLLF